MKSMLAFTIQRARLLAAEGPIPFRKLSSFLYTKLANNPGVLERVKHIKIPKTWSPWDEPDEPFNPKWIRDLRLLLKPGAKLPERVTVIGATNAKEKEDFRIACSELGIAFTYIDETTHDVISKIRATGPNMIFARPSHRTPNTRQLSREIYNQLAETELHNLVSPSPLELRIYESKRELAYFLQEEGIPHPKTRVFLNEAEALNFARSCTLPQVFKTATSASSSGVELLQTRRQMVSHIRRLFRSSYARRNLGDYRGIDFGYAIFQEYIPDVREHRVIKVGESWFGHEKSKLENQTFFSGSGVTEWTPPSIELLNFCKVIAEKYNILTTSFDVFENASGQYLVNEIQTWFGNLGRSQMYIDSVPGRFVYSPVSDQWEFEPGYFNINGSINLRVVETSNQFHKLRGEGRP